MAGPYLRPFSLPTEGETAMYDAVLGDEIASAHLGGCVRPEVRGSVLARSSKSATAGGLP
jgi:hypothetical protein